MTSHYKRIGDYVTQIKTKNTDGTISSLKGININKHFMPSVANVNGTDLSTYRVVKKNQFAFNPMHVGRDEVLPIALLEDDEPVIVSPAYVVFEVNDEQELLPAYLMMWCSRSEFDRNAWFMTDNSVRGGFSWDDFCELKLPIPSIEKQREIVREYNVVNDRIALNEQLIQKLEDTAQAIYKQWFVDFEFPISKEYAESIGKPELEGQPYKSSGGEMKYCEELNQYIPTNYELTTLGDLIYFQNGYGFKSETLLDHIKNEHSDYYAVFKMGHIKRGGGLNLSGTKSWIERANCTDLEQFLIKKYDLLMAMTDMKESIGLLGNTAVMPINNQFILNQRVGLIRPMNNKGVGYATIYYLTNSPIFLQKLRSSANIGVQVNLTKSAIIDSNLLIADKSFNERLESQLRKLLEKLNIIITQNVHLAHLKNLLLSQISSLKN